MTIYIIFFFKKTTKTSHLKVKNVFFWLYCSIGFSQVSVLYSIFIWLLRNFSAMFTKVLFFFSPGSRLRKFLFIFLTLVCDEWPPNSAYLPKEIPNPTYFQLFQPQPHYLAPGTVPVISFLGSQEDQEARHPEDGSWGWLVVCPIYGRHETILSIAPSCSFWLLLCTRLLSLTSASLICILVCILSSTVFAPDIG